MLSRSDSAPPKYLRVYAALRRDIESGRWKEGDQLPSELELVRTFSVSRITVTRAVRDLYQAGLVERVAGSGTFVRQRRTAAARSFGLLIPDLGETEIFEPICRGMMASPLARDCALLWGGAAIEGSSKEARAWGLCRQYIARAVAGVFFAPLELTAAKDAVNARILHALDEAREAIEAVANGQKDEVELSPQNAYVRRLQHQLVERHELTARSTGKEPNRRLRIYTSAD